MLQSLLYEACGRTVNPVDGAVGLLSRGKWHVCQQAVETALAGGSLTPLVENTSAFGTDESAVKNLSCPSAPSMHENQPSDLLTLSLAPKFSNEIRSALRPGPWSDCQRVKRSKDVKMSLNSEESMMTSFGSSGNDRKLLNLFV
jgi:hypothetical protein